MDQSFLFCLLHLQRTEGDAFKCGIGSVCEKAGVAALEGIGDALDEQNIVEVYLVVDAVAHHPQMVRSGPASGRRHGSPRFPIRGMVQKSSFCHLKSKMAP